MSTTTIITLVVVAVVVIAVAAAVYFYLQRQRQRQEHAREEYGPEYERAAEEHGSERKAEREMRQRRERVESEVRPLSEESRHRYRERWDEVERTFVDNPTAALDEADRVVRDIMQERNFPSESRQEATRDAGVMHSDVAEEYREAQRTHRDAVGSHDGERGKDETQRTDEALSASASSDNGVDLERMRQAIQKYRSMYERLTRE